MDDMYLREQVLPAVTVQAMTFAFITALIWAMCVRRACQLRREVEEYLEQHPDIEAANNRGDNIPTVASSDTTAVVSTNIDVASNVAVVSSIVQTSADDDSTSPTSNPIHATNLAPVAATATNIQVVPG